MLLNHFIEYYGGKCNPNKEGVQSVVGLTKELRV
jgi:hypothetical protein